MGQTLSNGLYLPDEGERNSYAGLEANWRTLDALILTVNGKAAPNVANTWTAAQTFTAGITGDLTGNVTGDLTGTASRSIADADGNTISSTYGKLAGSQTWTGNNTFTSTITTKTNVDRTVAPTSDTTYGTIICRDKNGSAMFRMQGTIKTDLSNMWDMMLVAPNASYITFFKYTISGSTSDRELRLKVTSVVPDDNATADLGISTNRWKSVYADSYYYGTTAWGLDKANVWTQSQTFKNNDVTIGTTTGSGYIGFNYTDSNNVYLAYQRTAKFSNGNTCLTWRIYNTDNNSQSINSELQFYITKANGKFFSPVEDGEINLGSSTNKFKTLNGINPGALSLPDLSNAVSIDTTNWDVTGQPYTNTYTPVVNGWLCVSIKDKATNSIFIYKAGGYSASAFGNGSQNADGRLAVMLPVLAGQTYGIIIKAGALSELWYAKFIPCLGNV